MQTLLRSSYARVLACVAVAAGAITLTANQPAPLEAPAFTAGQAIRGGNLYTERCAQCHGAALDDGQFAPALIGRSFAQRWQDRSLAEVFTLIRAQMPPEAPGSLSPAAAADVLAFILDQNGFAASTMELPSDAAQLQRMLAVKTP